MKPYPKELKEGIDDLDGYTACFTYEGRSSQAVRRLKYSRVTNLAEPMSKAVAERARELKFSDYLVVPVPIHRARRCIRGFNQSELLTEGFPQAQVSYSCLKRIRYTKPQVKVTAAKRRTNLQGAFRATGLVRGKHILLVDDVATTGGTAIECAKALKAAGAIRVTLLTYCASDSLGDS